MTTPAHPTRDGPQRSARLREALVLAVELDGAPQDEPVIVHRERAAVLMQAADLRRLGIRLPPATRGEVDLATLTGVRFGIDERRQVIDIVPARTDPTRLDLRAGAAIGTPVPTRAWGGLVNYEATAYHDATGGSLGGSVDAVAFTPRGYGYAGAIVRLLSGGGTVLTRTDMGYTIDRQERLLSATLGDYVNAASSVSRPVRLAGLRLGTDFSLRPDLVTFPLPSANGTASVPTAVDVLVNGDQQAAGEVRAGQFTVADIPVQTGVNTISVATRDALGRTQLQTVTTYASRDLLRRGLVAWSAEVGWVRTGYLTADDRYRALAATGTIRVGITDRLTAEGHVEAVARMQNLEGGASLSLGRFGLLGVAAGLSRDELDSRSGSQVSASLERVAHPVSVSARYVRQSYGWSDIAGRYGSVTRRHSAILNIGFDLGRAGTLGASLIGLGRGFTRFDPGGARLRDGSVATRASTLVNATYTARLAGKVGLVANVGTDTRQRNSLFASVGVLMLFGSRTSAYAGAVHQMDAAGVSASFTRNAVEQGQWGYRVAATTSGVDQAAAAVEYLGQKGDAQVAVQVVAGHLAGQASARGSIGFADGHAFASDTMTGSFAVIETRGQGGVPVYQDNRRIGVTNEKGILVAPNLPSLQGVKLSIDPVDVPDAAEIDRTDALVSIPRRSGAAIRFDLRPTRARLVRIVDEASTPLPAGAAALIAGRRYPIGLGGMLYAELPPTGARVVVMLGAARVCSVKMEAGKADEAGSRALVCSRNRAVADETSR